MPRLYSDKEEAERVTAKILSVDGVYVTPGQAPMAYGDMTPVQVLKNVANPWVYFYGGWNNGMTLRLNIIQDSLPGDIPLGALRVKDIKTGLQSVNCPPIFYDYRSDYDSLSGWRDMLRQKGISVSVEEYEEMTLEHLLLQIGGAPTRWTMMVKLPNGNEPLLPPITSSPFPGNEYGNGFIASYHRPFAGMNKSFLNTTGARAIDSIALANLIVNLRHGVGMAVRIYKEDAIHRLEKIKEKGGKLPFTIEEADRYAAAFVETQEPVVEDINRILSRYDTVDGFQYAVNITSDRSLATAIYKIPSSRPYAWIKTKEGWKQV
ncbi:MAG: hypothetical protein V1756_03170 [Patescibacteria group bacterium]